MTVSGRVSLGSLTPGLFTSENNVRVDRSRCRSRETEGAGPRKQNKYTKDAGTPFPLWGHRRRRRTESFPSVLTPRIYTENLLGNYGRVTLFLVGMALLICLRDEFSETHLFRGLVYLDPYVGPLLVKVSGRPFVPVTGPSSLETNL